MRLYGNSIAALSRYYYCRSLYCCCFYFLAKFYMRISNYCTVQRNVLIPLREKYHFCVYTQIYPIWMWNYWAFQDLHYCEIICVLFFPRTTFECACIEHERELLIFIEIANDVQLFYHHDLHHIN